MRYYQRNIPQPAKIYTFSMTNFTGGLNNKEHIIDDNQCSDVMNMKFTVDGTMEKRHGFYEYDEVVLTNPVTFTDVFEPYDGEPVFFRATDSGLYQGDTLIKSLAGQMYGATYQGKYFFCDGSGMYLYGNFTETASDFIKYIGTPVVSNAVYEVVAPPKDYTPLGQTYTQGVRVVDYTNRKVWYEPCENELIDTYKQGNVPPTTPRYILVQDDRLYVAGDTLSDDTVYITDVMNPYYYPAGLSLQLPQNSDKITGLAVYDDAVIVGRKRDIYAITGKTNRTDAGLPVYKLMKLNAHVGITNQRCFINAHNFLFFLGSDAQFYALRTISDESDVFLTSVISKTVNVLGKPVNALREDIWNSSAVFFEDHLYVTLGDKILVYSYLYQAWTVYDHLNSHYITSYMDNLLIATKDGKLIVHSDEYLDLGEPYKAYWTSKWFNMGDGNIQKMFRDFFLVSATQRDKTSRINVKFEIDYAQQSYIVAVQNQFGVWGKSRYGDRYINSEVNESASFMVYKRGRQIRFTFSSGEYISARVDTFEELETLPNIYDGMIAYVQNDLYVHEKFAWHPTTLAEYNQAMHILELNGEYEFKWKR